MLIWCFGSSSKQKKTNEDDQIYDTVSDEKSMSNIYGGSEYNASNSFNSSAGSGDLNKSIDEDKQKLNEGTMPRKQAPKTESKFSLRLKKFYSNIGQTLNLSSKILADANGANVALNNSCVKSSIDDKNGSLDESSMSKANLKMFSINEFNPNDVDIKYEKDIAIDTLKLCKTPSSANSTLRKAISMYKNNLEHQHHQQRANMGGDQEALNRSENVYVSNPIDNSSEDDQQAQKLQIYEVNFDNNYAYITPAIGSTTKNSSSDLGKNAAKPIVDNVAEIYQTINEMDDDDDDGEDGGNGEQQVVVENREVKPAYQSGKLNLADSQSIEDFSSIYQTPSNKRILSSTLQGSAIVPGEEEEEPAMNVNTSVIHLLNENTNNDETLA